MRRLPFALGVAMVSGALAAPAAPKLAWADWVGDWSGNLTWSSCMVEGAPSVTLPLDATDGAIAIDLGPIGAAYGAMSLVEDPARPTWLGQNGDVTLHLVHGAGTIELSLDLESGCSARGTLHRTSVGIAACDRLEAWARIENRCTKLARPALENTARLAHQRSEWAKATGDARMRLGSQCAARAAKVEAELVDAGCAPTDLPPLATRAPECQALRQAAAKLQRCGALPFEVATAIAHDANDLASAVDGTESTASLKIIETKCRARHDQVAATAKQAGCPR